LTRYQKATEYYQQSVAISREVQDRAGEGRTLNNLMLVWGRQHNTPLAVFYGKQAVNVFQEIRGNIKSLDKESQRSYLKSHEEAYRKLADLLISQGRLGEAEKVLELLKEEEFNRITRRNGPSDPRIGLTKTEAEASKINDQLASLASERGQLLAKVTNKTATDQDRQRLSLIEATITEVNKKVTLVLAEVAKAAPDDRLMIQQSQSMMQSLRKLGRGVVALYTVVTNDKGWVILTTPDFRRAYPINTTDLNKTISDFRVTLRSDRYDPVPLAQKLYGALFLQKNDEGATLAGDLKSYGARTLMWSLDGVLRYVPISALHDGKNYLVENYPNVVFTTASLTRLLDAAQGDWRAFGLGVSKQYQDFPALTAVPRELHSIIREAGSVQSHGVLPGVIRLDEQFTRKEMMNGLHEGYRVVHIASHFKFNAESEENSFLLLGDGSDLSLEEMQNLPGIFENVELLTLSACDTATIGANGKEMEGLAFVAQDLGAKAVVASLWPVADVGTEVLMREFYRLKRANPQWSKAEALRQTQIAMLKGQEMSNKRASEERRGIKIASETEGGMKAYQRDAKARFGHPHYWAPFILIGNWK
jgi:CHAT domain-containing protein